MSPTVGSVSQDQVPDEQDALRLRMAALDLRQQESRPRRVPLQLPGEHQGHLHTGRSEIVQRPRASAPDATQDTR